VGAEAMVIYAKQEKTRVMDEPRKNMIIGKHEKMLA
jgi:hypothetical protein